jgi:hypothetical protein
MFEPEFRLILLRAHLENILGSVLHAMERRLSTAVALGTAGDQDRRSSGPGAG